MRDPVTAAPNQNTAGGHQTIQHISISNPSHPNSSRSLNTALLPSMKPHTEDEIIENIHRKLEERLQKEEVEA